MKSIIGKRHIQSRTHALWRLMTLTVGLTLATACLDDEPADGAQTAGDPLTMDACVTRTGELPIASDGASMELFLTSDATTMRRRYTYHADNGTWTSNATVKPDVNYHICGYMPATDEDNVSVNRITYTLDNILVFEGLPCINLDDVCYVIGVRGGTDVTSIDDITPYQYQYDGQPKGQNHVNLLFEHLYAGMRLHFKIGSDYALLRSVRLKEVRLKTGSPYLQRVQIRLTTGAYPTFTYRTSDKVGTPIVVFSHPDGIDLSAEIAVDAAAYYIPSTAITGDVTMVCTYDVYDRKGNLIRANCQSENLLNETLTPTRGTMTHVTMVVNPTYLYMLSEPDLDNPTMTLSE